jgi:iron(III) transport system substrate-binding protein
MTGRCSRLFLAASLSVACLAGVVVAAQADDAKVAAARKEGQITWYVASISAHNAEAAGHAFTAAHGPKVNVVSGPSQVMFQRLTQNLSQNAYNADVFSSIDIGNFVTLKTQGALAAYMPATAAKLLPMFRGLDKDATFHATVGSVLVIAYNRDKVTADEAPKTWSDMLDPKWADKLVIAHPGFGIYAANWAVQVSKLYGKDYIARLHALRPQVARSMNDAMKMVASGERLVAAAPAAAALEAADDGKPLAVQYPSDGAILVTTPSAVLKSAPHPNAARLFMDYLLSPDFGEILVKAHYAARRTGVALPSGNKAVTDIKVIRPNITEMTKAVPQVTALWRDVFGK